MLYCGRYIYIAPRVTVMASRGQKKGMSHREWSDNALAMALAPCDAPPCGAIGEVRQAQVLVPDAVPLVHLHGLPKLRLRIWHSQAKNSSAMTSPLPCDILYSSKRSAPCLCRAPSFFSALHMPLAHLFLGSMHDMVLIKFAQIPQQIEPCPVNCLHWTNPHKVFRSTMSSGVYQSIWHVINLTSGAINPPASTLMEHPFCIVLNLS